MALNSKARKLVEILASEFSFQNPSFNREKFLTACGIIK
jgi:hypothetical protein